MPNVLILHSSIDGHTITICDRLSATLRAHGHSVRVDALAECREPDLRAADAVIVGASIRYGRHRPEVVRFMRRHQSLLEARVCAFFSVNLVARKAAKNQPDTNPYLRSFLRQIGWRPASLAVFAGRLDYPRCGIVDRQLIRLIMWMTDGPTDPGGVFEFTDWARVEALAGRVSALLVHAEASQGT